MPTTVERPAVHHVAVQTHDLDNSLDWYRSFFNATSNWTLDRFSELTRERLPGITRLTEVELQNLRLHLFERPAATPVSEAAEAMQFQHICLVLDSHEEMVAWRQKWFALRDGGEFRFASGEEPTDIVVDDDGMESFYFRDVNGLEFEFSWFPKGAA
ncbi:VOC family protein [Streptomyces sp. NPDC002838]|uniref:VOC family protein n=1 Tax=Streptomyces sp. NPDC002838 TaxID=3154436 RepID=UPI003319363F